jgi:predicted secreted protein
LSIIAIDAPDIAENGALVPVQITNSPGKIVPEYFMRNLAIRRNGKTVIEAQLGRSVSTNPLFAFKVQGAKANDRFALSLAGQ